MGRRSADGGSHGGGAPPGGSTARGLAAVHLDKRAGEDPPLALVTGEAAERPAVLIGRAQLQFSQVFISPSDSE